MHVEIICCMKGKKKRNAVRRLQKKNYEFKKDVYHT